MPAFEWKEFLSVGHRGLDHQHQQLIPMPTPAPAAAHNADALRHGVTTEDDALALTLDERGMICDCDGASEKMFGYRRSELVWRHVSMLLPQWADVELLQDGELNARLRFLCRLGGQFHGLHQSGERLACALYLNDLGNTGSRRLRLIVRREARRQAGACSPVPPKGTLASAIVPEYRHDR